MQSEITKQIRSNLIALPLALDDLPPWVHVTSVIVSDSPKHWIKLSVTSFRRLFAGKVATRDGNDLAIEHEGMRFYCTDYDLLGPRPTAYRLADIDPKAVELCDESHADDDTKIISESEAREVLGQQTVIATEAVTQ